jgi:hypothetical protein
VEIAFLETGADDFGNDTLGHRIRHRAFQAAADLDAQLAVVLRDQDEDAVVDALAAKLPGLGDADRIGFDGFRLRGGDQQDGNLAAAAFLEQARSTSSAAAWSRLSVPVRSVTRALSGGMATRSSAARAAAPSRISPSAANSLAAADMEDQ